jgi:hypothetical protein
MVDLDGADGVQGIRIAATIPGAEVQNDPYNRSEERKSLPAVFPTVHEAGFFVHKIDDNIKGTEGPDEKLLWFRHGREASPVTLEVPSSLRYGRPSNTDARRGWWSGNQTPERDRYRIMSSTISRVSWELDNRESDLLFAVMGPGFPSREKGSMPTGNQIQGWDLTDDAKLRVTLPNPKVENEEDKAFLQHVIFKGAPLVRDNRLYIAGAVTEKDSVEIWMFCFDVTPKGDVAAGEGKLQWRVHLCSQRQQNPYPWGGSPITVPEISSPSEQGGMIYVSTHAGATAAVDRATGELCWISKYGRVAIAAGGWFCGPPIATGGLLVTTPYDYNLALVLDAVWGTLTMEYPLFGKGPREDYLYVLGVVDNRMIIQGRSRIYSVGLTDFRKGGVRQADMGKLNYQSAAFGNNSPIGRGVIAGDRVLIPFKDRIAFYGVTSGKLLTSPSLSGVEFEKAPFTMTVYCRGEAYKDDQGIVRHKPVTVTDPDTGNVYNAEHLRNGQEFKFPSGKTVRISKETFLILTSAQWTYVFKAED